MFVFRYPNLSYCFQTVGEQELLLFVECIKVKSKTGLQAARLV